MYVNSPAVSCGNAREGVSNLKQECKHPGFARADAIVLKVLRWISYPPAILLLIIALLATVNVITSKLFHVIVPSANDWITYLMIPIVFLSLGHVHLDRGLVVVDFLNKHYPKWLLTVIDIISHICLIALSIFMAYRQFLLMIDKFKIKEMSSTDAGHFYMWPFAGLLALGLAIFTFTSFWSILRDIFDYHPAAPDPMDQAVAAAAEMADETGKERDAK